TDGVPDTEELASSMTPLTASDGFGDPDGDGLPTNVELNRGTNPKLADTDDDGRSDTDEIINVTDPLANDPARAPDALHVSPSAIMLTYDVAADTPLPQTVVYLTTQRTTTWTVSSNVNWLAGTAQDGQTPDSFTL